MNLTDAAVTAAATVQMGTSWASFDDQLREALRPQIITEVTAAFHVDRGALLVAGRAGAGYVPSDAAVMAAIATASFVHGGWDGYDEALKELLVADYRNEIAAAAEVQYDLQRLAPPIRS